MSKFVVAELSPLKQLMKITCLLWLVACNHHSKVSLDSISLHDTGGKEVNVGSIATNKILVMTFLTPDCPLCINYTRTLNSIKSEFSEKDVKFIAVFAGPYQETNEINNFLSTFHLDMQGVLDPDYRLTKVVNATVTPQVIVVSRTGSIAYSGVIDDWAYETGKKRSVVTKHFLRNSISKLLNDSLPDPSETEPVGCFIEL